MYRLFGYPLCLAVGVSVLGCSAATSQSRGKQATPWTVKDVLAGARDGDLIVLAPGDYGELAINNRKFKRSIKIDASLARMTNLFIRGSDGIDVMGGTVASFREVQQAVVVQGSRNVSLRKMHVSGARIAMTVALSQYVTLDSNDFDGTRSDGVNIAMSQHVRVTNNQCRNFDPIIADYDARGNIIKDGDHPDCVQGWSRTGQPITSDIEISGNVATGLMQGIFFGDTGNGGYERIVVRNNSLTLRAWNGIVLMEARNSTVVGNHVSTVKGARTIQYPFQSIYTWIRVTGEDNKVCGNFVETPRAREGTEAC